MSSVVDGLVYIIRRWNLSLGWCY